MQAGEQNTYLITLITVSAMDIKNNVVLYSIVIAHSLCGVVRDHNVKNTY